MVDDDRVILRMSEKHVYEPLTFLRMFFDSSAVVCDLCAGTGSLGYAALMNDQKFVILNDRDEECLRYAQYRLAFLVNKYCYPHERFQLRKQLRKLDGTDPYNYVAELKPRMCREGVELFPKSNTTRDFFVDGTLDDYHRAHHVEVGDSLVIEGEKALFVVGPTFESIDLPLFGKWRRRCIEELCEDGTSKVVCIELRSKCGDRSPC